MIAKEYQAGITNKKFKSKMHLLLLKILKKLEFKIKRIYPIRIHLKFFKYHKYKKTKFKIFHSMRINFHNKATDSAKVR